MLPSFTPKKAVIKMSLKAFRKESFTDPVNNPLLKETIIITLQRLLCLCRLLGYEENTKGGRYLMVEKQVKSMLKTS
jgi:hypothetical protein